MEKLRLLWIKPGYYALITAHALILKYFSTGFVLRSRAEADYADMQLSAPNPIAISELNCAVGRNVPAPFSIAVAENTLYQCKLIALVG